MFEYFKTLIEHATGNKTLSSALRPLDFFVPTLTLISILSYSTKAPIVVSEIFTFLAALSILLYIGAYIFFMLTDLTS